MIPYVSTREDRRRGPFRQRPAGAIDVPAAPSQQLGGRPQGKGESIVQICTLVTVLAGLVGLGLGVTAGGSLDALPVGADIAVNSHVWTVPYM